MAADEEPPKGGEPLNDKADDRPDEESEPEQLTGGGDAGQPADEDESRLPSGGSVEFQDAATTKPRPPTPAEQRARAKYEKKQRELEEARQAAEEKRRHQRRVLMGAAAAVGVVGLVAGLGYWALSEPNVTAQCVQDDPSGQPVIVPDSYCTGHTAGLNGFFFYGGHQYRYYYGSSGSVGSRPSGGTTVAPKGANITTKSGTSISRGGLGGSSPGKSSGS
ncbi:hypothetical protein [Mycobacterium genavense]|uniref:hypothetical protein n=1 Tax=Mycobacterium genavense TaxID=36812 RepID=UPI0004715A74|nr:hypothetical protein [Mycobacterium genavense]